VAGRGRPRARGQHGQQRRAQADRDAGAGIRRSSVRLARAVGPGSRIDAKAAAARLEQAARRDPARALRETARAVLDADLVSTDDLVLRLSAVSEAERRLAAELLAARVGREGTPSAGARGALRPLR